MIRGLFLFLLLIPFQGITQRPPEPQNQTIKGVVTGIIIDSLTKKPIDYAAVGIVDAVSTKIVNGGITDEKGVFRIGEIPPGSYQVHINFIGYSIKVVHNIILTENKP